MSEIQKQQYSNDEKGAGIAAFIALVVCVWWAWHNRFTQDDAFISYRYAANLADGHGLVFNIGERLEGYTNFLYTLWMALPEYIGLPVIIFSYLSGMVFWVIGLFFLYRSARHIHGVRLPVALACTLLVASNYSFNIYATGGLETSMLVMFLTALYWFLFAPTDTEETRYRYALTASLLAGAALLTRLDAALFVSILMGVRFIAVLAEKQAFAVKRRQVLLLLVPGAMILGVFLLWKLWYYGDILPNTFYAKVGGYNSFSNGLAYARGFYTRYWLWPLAAVPLFAMAYSASLIRRLVNLRPTRHGWPTLALLILAILWSAYVINIGGDFMEYRFFVPLVPFLGLLLLELTKFVCPEKTQARYLMLMLMTILSVVSWHNHPTLPAGVDSRENLYGKAVNAYEDWPGAGKSLGKAFAHAMDVTIAVTAAGFVPYYSKLTAIDMFGLNDAWVAKHGIYVGSRAGHQKMSPLEYLLERGTDFIITHPITIPKTEIIAPGRFNVFTLQYLFPFISKNNIATDTFLQTVLSRAKVIRLPLNDRYDLLIIWLSVDSPEIARIIERSGWQVYPIQSEITTYIASSAQLEQPKPEGSLWNAPSNITLTQNIGIEIRFPELQKPDELEISLDNNDGYYLLYLRNGENIAGHIISPRYLPYGLAIHRFVPPTKVLEQGFDTLIIAAAWGDGAYAIGHIKVLGIHSPDKIPTPL